MFLTLKTNHPKELEGLLLCFSPLHLQQPDWRKGYVVQHAQVGEQVKALIDEAYTASYPVQIRLWRRKLVVSNVDGALVRNLKQIHGTQEYALSSAGFTNYDDPLTLLHSKAYILEYLQGTKGLGDVLNPNHAHCLWPPFFKGVFSKGFSFKDESLSTKAKIP